jgi:hypothetical protein
VPPLGPPRATYFGENSLIGTPEEAEARFQYFRKGVTLPSVERTGGKLDFKGLGTRWARQALWPRGKHDRGRKRGPAAPLP